MMTTLLLAAILNSQPPAPPARVKIDTPGGGILAAAYYDAGPGAPGVLFFPMCRADAMDGWSPVAERLRAAGVSSLAIAYRGYGESTSGPNPQAGDQRVADADAAFAYLQSRVGARGATAVAGSSCGVFLSFATASRHPGTIRAVVAMAGPHTEGQLAYVRQTPGLAVFSGASEGEPPAVEWARALKASSGNSASRLTIPAVLAHGTDMFATDAALATDIADWLAARLR